MYGVFLQLALLPSVPNRTILSGFSLLSLSSLITWLLMVSSSNVVTARQHLSWGVWRLGRQCFGCMWLVYTRSLLAWARFLWIDTFLFLLGEILLSYPSLNSVTMKVRNYLLLWLDCLLWWNIHDTQFVIWTVSVWNLVVFSSFTLLCSHHHFQNVFIIPNRSFQFSSVAQSCPPLCDPMNRSMPGLPVHHQLLGFTQTHVSPRETITSHSSSPRL